MKKILLITSLLAGAAMGTFAQDNEVVGPDPRAKIDVNRLRFGGYFAPNISWMKPTAAKTDDGLFQVSSGGSKVGYTWGLLIDYYFAPNYGIATGFQVNTTGGLINSERIIKSTLQNTVNYAEFKYALQYLEVPFNLKLKSDEIAESGIQLFGQVGVTAGVNIGKKATYTVNYIDNDFNTVTSTQEREKLVGSLTIAPLMMSLNIGGGMEKPISERMSAYFGVFFNNGFVPDATNPAKYDLAYTGSFSDGNIRVNSFAFRLGLFF